MSEQRVASRYAKSILDLSIERNLVEKVFQDMSSFVATCKGSKDLQNLLKNPIVPPGKKISILKALFGEGFQPFQPLTLMFFDIMINKERPGLIYAAAQEFIGLYNTHNQVLIANITTATELSRELEDEILSKIKGAYQGEVQVKKTVDPAIIGGFILKVGDKQLDSSLLRELNNLNRSLVDTSFART